MTTPTTADQAPVPAPRRPRRWRRLVKRILLTLITLLLLILALAYWLLGTASGYRQLPKLINRLTPYTLSYDQLDGALLGSQRWQNLHLSGGGLDIHAADLHLDLRAGELLGVQMERDGAIEIGKRARGTPRIANRLLRRVRDYADVRGSGIITRAIADEALELLAIDHCGFDNLDRRLLHIIIEHFGGGPVGLDTLAASVGEERGTLEDVVEPYLIQQGYLQRTPRGRVATARAYAHLGIEMPKP